ncbi:MAG: cytochrome C [Flavobacteriales bacterium TMED191]|nr:MAG: cytochrome C [Flavobacteriales bacterium TMED191]
MIISPTSIIARFCSLGSVMVILFLSIALQPVFSQDVEAGASLFKTNCASCHYLGPEDKKLIGPGLNDEIFEEYTQDWLYSWIRNSSEMIESGDKQAVAIYEEYNKAVMTAFPYFSNEDIDNILAYIKEGPINEEVVVSESTEYTEIPQNNNLLYIVLFIVIFNTVLLIYVKNVLKDAAGVQRTGFFNDILSWIKLNPSFIVLFSVLVVFSGIKGCWNATSKIGVAQNYQPDQPIAFSHQLHAGEQGIDCNYCHHSARESKHSGIPSANVCMNCHTYVNEGRSEEGTKEINKIYEAIGFDPNSKTYIPGYDQKPIEWVRIHNLPDLAYFNHSQHVNVAGLDCQTCHGPVEEMDVAYQYSKLTMGWCINCHREEEIDTDNPYYHDLHEKWIDKYHGEEITVDMIGGRECAKCHY